jgi:hypothetical protein
MRTTVNIDEQLLQTAKERAHERGLTLGEYVERALRHESARIEPADRPEVPVLHGGQMNPAIDPDSNRAMWEFLDEGVSIEKRR